MGNTFLLVAASLPLFLLPWASLRQAPQERSSAPLRMLPAGSRVAVFAAESRGGRGVDNVVGDMLTAALRRAGLRVIERIQLDAILKEQRLAREGVIDPATAVPAGKVLGVDYLIGAKATEFGIRTDRVGGAVALGPVAGLQIRTQTARVVLDLRLLDATTGAVLVTETAEGQRVHHGGTLLGGTIVGGTINLGGIDIGSKEWSESSLGKAARRAVDALMLKLVGKAPGAQGSILAVLPGGQVVVGVGQFDGVRVGDVLDVLRLERIKDSKGSVVWTEERAVGQIRIVELRGDRAKAVPVERDPAFAEGDIVTTRGSGRS